MFCLIIPFSQFFKTETYELLSDLTIISIVSLLDLAFNILEGGTTMWKNFYVQHSYNYPKSSTSLDECVICKRRKAIHLS